jgi:hypothetical protein
MFLDQRMEHLENVNRENERITESLGRHCIFLRQFAEDNVSIKWRIKVRIGLDVLVLVFVMLVVCFEK